MQLPSTVLHVDFDEPRILDTDLAKWLGYRIPAQIRELIVRNRDELADHGSFSYRTKNPGTRGGRPAQAYFLNEGQALVLCALSRTPKAAQVRKALIDLFTAWRQGKVVDVRAHRRRKPSRDVLPAENDYDNAYMRARGVLAAFWDNEAAMLDIMAGVFARLDMLESRQ